MPSLQLADALRHAGDAVLLAAAVVAAVVCWSQAGTAWVRGAIMLVRSEAGAETMDAWRQDLQRSPVAERFGRLALELAAPDAIIVCDWEQATVLWYLQRVEGRAPRPDDPLPDRTPRRDASRGPRHWPAVYITRTLPGVESRGVTSSVGPLLQVHPAPPVLPSAPLSRPPSRAA